MMRNPILERGIYLYACCLWIFISKLCREREFFDEETDLRMMFVPFYNERWPLKNCTCFVTNTYLWNCSPILCAHCSADCVPLRPVMTAVLCGTAISKWHNCSSMEKPSLFEPKQKLWKDVYQHIYIIIKNGIKPKSNYY